MTNLKDAWLQIKYYLQTENLSIIPVRDKPQIIDGREYPAKTPFGLWKKYQQKVIDEKKLFYDMTEKYDTTAIAIVCGKVSGNLEVIDIDVKNWIGIDALLFTALQNIYPEVFEKLRIHKSPSGGFHILYKVSDGVIPGNKKLCRKEGVKEAAIETRGEGGFVLSPPAVGYSVYKDCPIPTITFTERCSIIGICESFNQQIKIEKSYKETKHDNRVYSVNPFEDFNQNSEAESVLINYGWREQSRSNKFIWFTRPDKLTGISASFNLEKRIYYIFTSSTEFEPDRGYNPATVLSILAHNKNLKETFIYLTKKGYGKVVPSVERQLVERNARSGKDVPINFSDEAKKSLTDLKAKLTELHQYGTFWDKDDEDKIKISREKIYRVTEQMGFRYNKGDVVKIDGKLLYKIDEREFQDALKNYIKEPNEELNIDIKDALESFMQRSGSFTMKRLIILDSSQIIKDTKDNCFKFYANGFLNINNNTISFLDYDSIDGLIWADKVINRNYNKHTGGKYKDYLSKALVEPDKIMPTLGYLAHEYKDETTGYIIVLTEQCSDPKNGGGSGKNVFCNLLKQITTYTSKPGVQAKFDEKFFQSWNGQKVFGISDVPKNFDFSFLKEPSTGSFIWKKLFKDEVEVDVQDAPKFIVQTNFSYEVSDGGLKRRIIPIEFTDFFTKAGGLDVYFGCHFPNEWNTDDWAGFDTYIAESVQQWLIGNRKLHATALTNTGWDKQFEHTYGKTTANFIVEHYDDFVKLGYINNEDFNNKLLIFYNENGISKNFYPSSIKINDAFKYYCGHKGVEFSPNIAKKVNGVTIKCRIFKKETEILEEKLPFSDDFEDF